MAKICPTCGHEHRDATDDIAEQRGRLTYTKAAWHLGRSIWWVKQKIADGRLTEVEWMGRKFVSEASVQRALAELGYPDPDSQALERLEERGLASSPEAIVLRERMQRQADESERRMLGGPTIAELSPPAIDSAVTRSVIADPIDSFITDYLGGR